MVFGLMSFRAFGDCDAEPAVIKRWGGAASDL